MRNFIQENKIVLRTALFFLVVAMMLGLCMQGAVQGKTYHVKDTTKILEGADVTVLHKLRGSSNLIEIINGKKSWFAVPREGYIEPIPKTPSYYIVDAEGNVLQETYWSTVRPADSADYVEVTERLAWKESQTFWLNRETLELIPAEENNPGEVIPGYTVVQRADGSGDERWVGVLNDDTLVVWDVKEKLYRYYTVDENGVTKVEETKGFLCFMDFEDGYALACRPKEQEKADGGVSYIPPHDPIRYSMEEQVLWTYVDENYEPILDFVFREASFSKGGYAVVIDESGTQMLLDLRGKGGRPWTLELN